MPAGPGRAGPAPVLEHRRPEPGRPGRPLPGRGELDLSAEDTAALAQAMTRHLSWQVISAQEDPGAGTASVTVSLTNLDMAPVVGQFLQEAFSDALSSALQADGQQPTEEEMTQQYLQTLTDLLNQEELDTRPPRWRSPHPGGRPVEDHPPTRPWWTPCWGPAHHRGGPHQPAGGERRLTACLLPPSKRALPRWGGPVPFFWTGPRRAVWAARLGRPGPVSSSCCGCSWPRRAPPPSRAGCWEGRTPPRGKRIWRKISQDPRPPSSSPPLHSRVGMQ